MASSYRCALVLAWLLSAAAFAQVTRPDPGLADLQEERKRLRELPLDETLDERLEEFVLPEPAIGLAATQALRVRREIAAFDRALAPADKLTRGQTRGLFELLQQARGLQAGEPVAAGRAVRQHGLSWLSSRYRAIETEERRLRDRELQADVLLARLPQVLQPVQIRTFARLEADALNTMRQHLAELRYAAGLSEEVAAPAVPPAAPSL